MVTVAAVDGRVVEGSERIDGTKPVCLQPLLHIVFGDGVIGRTQTHTHARTHTHFP